MCSLRSPVRLGLACLLTLFYWLCLNRKPDPEFYKHALDLLKVQASEVVFLDDIGPNLKAAQKLGITTIRKFSVSPPSAGRAPRLHSEFASGFLLSTSLTSCQPFFRCFPTHLRP